MGDVLQFLGAVILIIMILLIFVVGVALICENIYHLQPFMQPVYP